MVAEKNPMTVAIENIFFSLTEDFHTCLPGRVEKYDFKTQKATVKPLLKKVYNDKSVLEMPVLPNVPVIFPRTKRSGVTFPLERGDGVLLLFTERALERWKLSGDVSEPGDSRRFDLTDSVCIPGLFSFNQTNIASNNDDLEIQHEGQKVTIKKNGDIELGAGESLLSLVNETFLALYDSHTHLYAPGPGAPVPSGTPLPVSNPTNQTSKVRAE